MEKFIYALAAIVVVFIEIVTLQMTRKKIAETQNEGQLTANHKPSVVKDLAD